MFPRTRAARMFPRTRAAGNDKERNKAKQCCNVATIHSFNETIIRGLEVFPPSSKFGSPNSHGTLLSSCVFLTVLICMAFGVEMLV